MEICWHFVKKVGGAKSRFVFTVYIKRNRNSHVQFSNANSRRVNRFAFPWIICNVIECFFFLFLILSFWHLINTSDYLRFASFDMFLSLPSYSFLACIIARRLKTNRNETYRRDRKFDYFYNSQPNKRVTQVQRLHFHRSKMHLSYIKSTRFNCVGLNVC